MSLVTTLIRTFIYTDPHDAIQKLASSNQLYAESGHRWVFRGQQDAPAGDELGELVASAHRVKDELAGLVVHDLSPVGERTTSAQLYAEFRLVMDFIVGAARAGLSLPGFDFRMLNTEGEAVLRSRMQAVLDGNSRQWPIDNLLSATAIAQHYGIPTCMLDWSDSGYTALYFAASGASKRSEDERGDIAVWAMNVDLLKELFPDDVTPLNGRIRIVEAPRYLCPNLAAQRGLFSVAEVTSELSEIFLPIYIEKEISRRLQEIEDAGSLDQFPNIRLAKRKNCPILMKHIVSGEYTPMILRLLAYEGIGPSLLFPGYSGIVRNIQQEQFWDKLSKHNRWKPREEI